MKLHKAVLTISSIVALTFAGCSSDSDGGDTSIVDIDKANAQPPSALDTSANDLIGEGLQGFEAVSALTSEAVTIPSEESESTMRAMTAGAVAPQVATTVSQTVDVDGDGTDDFSISGQMDTQSTSTGATSSWSVTAEVLEEIVFTDAETGFTSSVAAGASFTTDGNMTMVNNGTQENPDFSFTMSLSMSFNSFNVSWNDGATSGSTSFEGRTTVDASGTFSDEIGNMTMSMTYELIAQVTSGEDSLDFQMLAEASGTVDFSSFDETSIAIEVYVSIDGTTYGPFTEEDIDGLIAEDMPVN